MKRKLLPKLVPGLCASLVLVSATSLTGCSTDTKTATTASDADKSETVYVKADASGTIHEIKVQTDLKNNGTSKEIKDFSTLKDIKNTKGNESFTQSPDGTITWENKGEDIHYEGTSTEELPVNVKISYTLDGKSIQPEDLSGKSGKLGIRFDYKNTTEENVTINGEEMTSPVPFAVISAMILPEDTASNIQVTNGKIFTMNDQSVVVGYACPGLKDSLKLTDYEPTEDISIPESVEVTADVTDFEMDFTATVVSSGLFEDLEEDSFDDICPDFWYRADIESALENAGLEVNDANVNATLKELGFDNGWLNSNFHDRLAEMGNEMIADAVDNIEPNGGDGDSPEAFVDRGISLKAEAESMRRASQALSADGSVDEREPSFIPDLS